MPVSRYLLIKPQTRFTPDQSVVPQKNNSPPAVKGLCGGDGGEEKRKKKKEKAAGREVLSGQAPAGSEARLISSSLLSS